MIVTLLTDFGVADHYVAAMKGVILSRDRAITIVDVSHDVPLYNLQVAGFLLESVYRDFPEGTVHTVVVDPGVGSSRRPIAASKNGFFFVGPDNGVLDPALTGQGPSPEVRAIENPQLMRHEISRTFHGRDIFAPTAAALASGFPWSEVGPELHIHERLDKQGVERLPDGRVVGRILHVDRYGNCVSSFRSEDLGGQPTRFDYQAGGRKVSDVREYFAGATAGVPFAYWGSSAYLELAVYEASAAELLGLRSGAEIVAVPKW